MTSRDKRSGRGGRGPTEHVLPPSALPEELLHPELELPDEDPDELLLHPDPSLEADDPDELLLHPDPSADDPEPDEESPLQPLWLEEALGSDEPVSAAQEHAMSTLAWTITGGGRSPGGVVPSSAEGSSAGSSGSG